MKTSSICIFCCKSVNVLLTDSNHLCQNKTILCNFHKSLERYFGTHLKVDLVNLLLTSEGKLQCCEQCLSIIQLTCNLYHEMKYFELQLQSKIDTLKNITQFAAKVKGRQHLLQVTLNGSEEKRISGDIYKRVKTFRKDFVKKCKRHFARSFPRVILKRENGNGNILQQSDTSPEAPASGTVSIIHANTNLLFAQALLQVLIRWSLSLSLVALLSASSPSSIYNLTEILSPIEYDAIDMEEDNGSAENELDISTPPLEGLKCEDMITNNDANVYTAFSPTNNDINDDNVSLISADADPEEIDFKGNSMMNEGRATRNDFSSPKTEPGIEETTVIFGNQSESSNKSLEVPVHQEETQIIEDSNGTRGRYNLRANRTSKKLPENDDQSEDSQSEEEYSKEMDDSSATSESGGDCEEPVTTQRCQFCDMTFKREACLKTHIRKKHNGKTSSTSGSTKYKYFCADNRCNEGFKGQEEYKNHIKLHGSFSCTFCDTVQAFAPDLCLHEMEHAVRDEKVEGYIYCPRCPFEVTTENLYVKHHLIEHMKIVSTMQSKFLKRWECSICKAVISEDRKDHHFLSHHDTRGVDPSVILKCDVEGCPAYFVQKSKYWDHMTQIHDKDYTEYVDKAASQTPVGESSTNCNNLVEKLKFFDCKLCGKKFKLQSWLNHHQKTQHHRKVSKQRKKRKRKLFPCPEAPCSESFESAGDLERHVKLHGAFKCNFCDVEKGYAPDLALHEIEHAIGNPNDIPDGSNAPSNDDLRPLKYNCPRCKYISTKKAYYILHHVQKHLNLTVKTQVCEICGVPAMAKQKKRHFRTHHLTEGVDPQDLHRCDQCTAYFLTGLQLLTHQNKVHNKEFDCAHCDMTFSTRKVLKIHLRVKHPNIDYSHLPIGCEVPNCEKRFATKPELEWHTTYEHVKHEKYSGFVNCKICNKKCLGQTGLRVHVRNLHKNKDKPKKIHVCDQCGKSFGQKSNLERHEMFHEDPSLWPFKCSVCSKTCPFKEKLEEHMRVHSQEKPFVCETCGEKYAHRHNLRLHVKNKHGLDIALRKSKSKVKV